MRYINGHGMRGKSGAETSRWNGGRTHRSDGYLLISKPDHPAADKDGYVIEHRYVAEQTIGRYLYGHEVVHHINGIKTDNRPENLQVMTRREHAQLHPVQSLARYYASADRTAQRSAAGKKGAEARWGKRGGAESAP